MKQKNIIISRSGRPRRTISRSTNIRKRGIISYLASCITRRRLCRIARQKWNRRTIWRTNSGITLLTQIRNIRKMILPTQMPSPILKTCVSISAMKRPHVNLTPLHIPFPALSQVRRVELVTAPTQGASWLLYDDDADTQLAADMLTWRVPSLSCVQSLNRIKIVDF